MDKKYFFFDIDGTLFSPSNGILESTKVAIKALKANGHFVAIASGRSLAGVKIVSDELDIQNIVCDGGLSGVIANQYIFNQGLDLNVVEKAIKFAKRNNLAYGVSDLDYFYSVCEEIIPKIVETHPWLTLRNRELLLAEKPIVKKFFILLADVKTLLDFDAVDEINTLYFAAENLLVSDQDLKYQGVKNMMDYLQADQGQVVVFGDSENDIQMFNLAPLSICMGQAKADVKKHASMVCDDVDNDGIYKACKLNGWI